MQRCIAMTVVALATILESLAIFVGPYPGAASAATLRSVPAVDLSDIDAAEYERAAVTLDGGVLFQVRGFPAYPADERAKAIQQRIEDIAADASVSLDSLRMVDMEDRTGITAGDQLVAGFIDADGAAEGVSRQIMAERALIKIAAAMASYRNDRSPRVLLTNTVYVLGATALLAIVLLLIRGAFRKLDAVAERRFKARIEAVEAQSHQIVQAQQLRKALSGILKGLYALALLVVGYVYLHFVLGLYPWTRPLAARLLTLFLDPLQSMGMGLLDSLPGLAFVAVVVIVTRYILRLTRLYVESIDRGTVTHARFDREWALPTYRIARLLVIAFAVVVAYPYIPGSSSEAFKRVSIFLGVVVSLGSSSVIANLIAGYAMIYRRAFRVGDRISIDNVIGDVTERRLMVTHLRTIKNEEIVVPNSTIINSSITNYSTLAGSSMPTATTNRNGFGVSV
jgi:small-conductance mechanosensitive channel